MPEDLERIAEWMRRDWDQRAHDDAEHFVYTRDAASDEASFAASGRANYDQLVRPYLPVLLNGAAAADCRVLEIGCGVGRMTRCFAEAFGEVHALDVAPRMIEEARSRLADCANVSFHVGSGAGLETLADGHCDLIFSYIVFQHIPSAAVIRKYVHEAARALKTGGAFKFQVNGDQSAEYRRHARDTWLGESFSRADILDMLREAGLTLEAMEDSGTQYCVVTARKGRGPDRRSYFLPGEPEDGGWRPAAPRTKVRLHSTGMGRAYAGLYFWPVDPHLEHTVSITANGVGLAAQVVREPGDHFFEWTLPDHLRGPMELDLAIEPACAVEHRPALRIIGIVRS